MDSLPKVYGQQNKFGLHYVSDGGVARVALVKTTRTAHHCVVMLPEGNAVLKFPIGAVGGEVLFRGKPYPMKRALRVLRQHAKVCGTTQGATAIINEASSEAQLG